MNNLDRSKLPEHVAIIMDGNRRWAKAKGLPAAAGHKKVVSEVIEELIETAGELGIPYITFWAWSSENWKRSPVEVKAIMQLFRWGLKNKIDSFIRKGARFNVIGDWKALDKDIVEGIEDAIERSKDNTKITVTIAVNYGGRDELLRAIQKLQATSDKLQASEDISQYLDTAGMPDPDVIIRPGGEQRLSGFMLWQCEYSELIFPKVLMPDFGREEFTKALEEFEHRQRRFGGS